MSRSAGQSSPRAATQCTTPGSSAAPSMSRSARSSISNRAVQPNLEISKPVSCLSGRSTPGMLYRMNVAAFPSQCVRRLDITGGAMTCATYG